jgi:hypothetical protein
MEPHFPERQRAAAELDDTLRRLAVDLELIDEGEVITAWVLVGHAAMPADVEGSRYFKAVSRDAQPHHVTVGLLRTGLDLTVLDPEEDDQ